MNHIRPSVGARSRWQQIAAGMARAEVIKQPLVVGVRHRPLTQQVGQASLKSRGIGRKVRRRPGPLRMPERHGLTKQSSEPQPKRPPPAPLRLQQLTHRPLQMGDTLLLLDLCQGMGIVAPAAVAAQDPA